MARQLQLQEELGPGNKQSFKLKAVPIHEGDVALSGYLESLI